MRRLLFGFLVTLLVVPLSLMSVLGAQDATPSADESFTAHGLPVGTPVEVAPGVVAEILNIGMPATAPDQNVVLYRVTIQPGGVIPDHIHPGTTVLSVEAGTFQWTLHQGTVWVTRGADDGAVAPPEQVTEVDTVLELEPGDGLFYNADVVHTAENVGDEPAVVIIASLWTGDQPAVTITDEQGTPLPAGTPAS